MSDEQAMWSDEIVYLAEMFHDIYEIEATRFGLKSQTPVPFDELPEANKQTMLCTVARVRGQMLASLRSNPPQQGDSELKRELDLLTGALEDCIGRPALNDDGFDREAYSAGAKMAYQGALNGLTTLRNVVNTLSSPPQLTPAEELISRMVDHKTTFWNEDYDPEEPKFDGPIRFYTDSEYRFTNADRAIVRAILASLFPEE